MHLNFLGDVLDHWKSSLFRILNEADVLADFAVDPMVTEQEDELWSASAAVIFARILCLKPEQILSHQVRLREDRRAYFTEISHRGDLFLDPDVGIQTQGVRAEPEKYLKPLEVKDLLQINPYRLLIVFQFVRSRRVADRLKTIFAEVATKSAPLHGCAYKSGNAAMVFLAKERSRIRRVEACFESLLGEHAERRLYRWAPKED